jgi:hypothetical protein
MGTGGSFHEGKAGGAFCFVFKQMLKWLPSSKLLLRAFHAAILTQAPVAVHAIKIMFLNYAVQEYYVYIFCHRRISGVPTCFDQYR